MITFYKSGWNAVVYPAECTRASAAGDQIHLHVRHTNSLHYAVRDLLGQINTRIGECFSVMDGKQTPVVQEFEAKCTCVQRTSFLAVAAQGGGVTEVQDVVSSAETESVFRVDEAREAETADISNSPSSPRVQTGSAQDIDPATEPTGPDTSTPLLASLRGEGLTGGAFLNPPGDYEDHLRDFIREEIHRVLGAAMGSLPPRVT